MGGEEVGRRSRGKGEGVWGRGSERRGLGKGRQGPSLPPILEILATPLVIIKATFTFISIQMAQSVSITSTEAQSVYQIREDRLNNTTMSHKLGFRLIIAQTSILVQALGSSHAFYARRVSVSVMCRFADSIQSIRMQALDYNFFAFKFRVRFI